MILCVLGDYFIGRFEECPWKDIGGKTLSSGLLSELIALLRRSRPGNLIAVCGDDKGIGPE